MMPFSWLDWRKEKRKEEKTAAHALTCSLELVCKVKKNQTNRKPINSNRKTDFIRPQIYVLLIRAADWILNVYELCTWHCTSITSYWITLKTDLASGTLLRTGFKILFFTGDFCSSALFWLFPWSPLMFLTAPCWSFQMLRVRHRKTEYSGSLVNMSNKCIFL